jgi:serine/threonine protein kinase
MGEVYRARDTRLNRDVAIKILPVAFAAEPDRLARFEREARVLAALNHPNIATIHGIEAHGGVPALVMELVEGETLRERLAGSPGRGLPLPTVRLFGRHLADALDAAHEKGIVHRDLKPANIQITADDVVKVLDFGLAKAVAGSAGPDASDATTMAEATEVGLVLGTIAYMSPEQARGQVVDKRTDIWAFGCVVYEMLTGRRAFGGESASDTIAAILGGGVDWGRLPRDTPLATRRLIERCLATNVKHRMRDIGDARGDLDES